MTDTVLSNARLMGFVASAQHEAAKNFYGETLGLTFLSEDQFALTFSVSGKQVLRIQKMREWQPPPFTVFGWQVDDIGEAVANLAAHGVKFEQFGFPSQDARGINMFENGDKVAWFKDPDGNTLSLAQLVSQ